MPSQVGWAFTRGSARARGYAESSVRRAPLPRRAALRVCMPVCRSNELSGGSEENGSGNVRRDGAGSGGPPGPAAGVRVGSTGPKPCRPAAPPAPRWVRCLRPSASPRRPPTVPAGRRRRPSPTAPPLPVHRPLPRISPRRDSSGARPVARRAPAQRPAASVQSCTHLVSYGLSPRIPPRRPGIPACRGIRRA